jgi:hypothetical protein
VRRDPGGVREDLGDLRSGELVAGERSPQAVAGILAAGLAGAW